MDGNSLSWKRTAAGSIVPVGTGVDRIPVNGASLAARAAALSSLLPEDVVMVRRTAAWIWGLDVLPPGVDEADWEIELVMAAGTGNPSGTHATSPLASVGAMEAVPITSESSETAFDASSASPGSALRTLGRSSEEADSLPSTLGVPAGPFTDAGDFGRRSAESCTRSGRSSLLSSNGSSLAGADSVMIPADHVVEEAGVRITSLTRTALDCARWLPRYEAVAALDQFLRRGVAAEELTGMARALPGYRGNKRLREVVRLSDRGAASPGESWVRVAVVKSGFPRPEAQVPVMGPHGKSLYVDLGYPEFRVGVEYDGERYHSGRTARAHDERRRAWLAREMGWEIVPVTKDFLRRPAPYLEALLTAMLHRGWTPDDTTMERLALRLARLAHRRVTGA
ncbi:hypothetical protein [Actinomadura sp. 7K534]|uniref:hypothetical protein n=1 Tax=Actinomadura sp. 7K534 TaxID=2530366 RepID=UPI00104EB857|nr:hypothetical protein [Actinomadura sp. 7K534]TDB88141.1 hypothetical protein E1266_31755 [Actinomadura sp. 7K534]